MTDHEKDRRAAQSRESIDRKNLLAEYYSKSQLAAELDITPRSLERWRWLRRGPAVTKIGHRVYYHRAAVEAWLANQTEATK